MECEGAHRAEATLPLDEMLGGDHMEHRSQSALKGGARVPFDMCKICFTYSRVECPHLTPLLLLAALKCEAAKT
jgi:hypothetical protein